MKLKALVAAIAGLLTLPFAAEAKFAQAQLQTVPIAKITANLEARLNLPNASNEDKARLEFQIGRLHSMAYALKTEDAQCRKNDGPSANGNSGLEPFYGYAVSDYRQFILQKNSEGKKSSHPETHLKEAIAHYRKALDLNPNLEQAKLGLAWCLDQKGEKTLALPKYREVFKTAWDTEKSGRGGLMGTSVVVEVAEYLLPLLDPTRDAAEIADIEKKREQVGKAFRMVTPIVVPLNAKVRAEELMASLSVTFDLDGNGPLAYCQWPTNKSGWLVYDETGSATISSGLELFGKSTFWIFWRDGYEALSSLDANNDGTLEGAELNGIRVWSDANSNGICDTGELRSLESCGIVSLSCKAKPGFRGFLQSELKFVDGATAPTVDWIVQPER